MVVILFNYDASIYDKYYTMDRNELKKYLESDNKSGYKTREKHIKYKFPETYENIVNICHEHWFTDLYNFVNNVSGKTCAECGKALEVKIFNLGYPQFCSVICKNQNTGFKEKVKKSVFLKYGVDNPSKSDIVKKKIKDKLFTDGKWYVETDEYKKKSKETCTSKYGTDSYSKLAEYHEKVKQTSVDRYGVDSYNKTDEYKEYCKTKNLEKYGTEWFQSTEEFKEKSKKTNLKKRGVISHTKTDEYKLKMKAYYLNKYGIEHHMQTEEGKKKVYDAMIEKYGELWLKHIPSYNANSIIYLDMLSEKLKLPIQHALNGGEKKFIRYWVDGYIQKYNICIEWDEKHHNSERQKIRDANREEFLISNFNCKIFRINEREFFKNIVTSIDDIAGHIINYIAMIGNMGG